MSDHEKTEAHVHTVYVLWHVREDNGSDDEKLIGIYSSASNAEAAVARLRDKPGFDRFHQGFQIHEHRLDRDGWTEGFVAAGDALRE